MSNLVTCLNRAPTYEWYVVWCGSKNGYQKDMYLFVRSKYDKHSRFNSQHNLGGGYMTI